MNKTLIIPLQTRTQTSLMQENTFTNTSRCGRLPRPSLSWHRPTPIYTHHYSSVSSSQSLLLLLFSPGRSPRVWTGGGRWSWLPSGSIVSRPRCASAAVSSCSRTGGSLTPTTWTRSRRRCGSSRRGRKLLVRLCLLCVKLTRRTGLCVFAKRGGLLSGNRESGVNCYNICKISY